MPGRVAWISIAPVKGLGLVHPEAVHVYPEGVRENRRFHLVDAKGRLVNGKRFGRLVSVRPVYDADSRQLALTLPGGEVVAAAVELGEATSTVFFGRPVVGRFVVGPWDEALSTFAGQPLRLVQPDVPGAANDRGRTGAVSLLGTGSLRALREHGGPQDERRFRMLFGIDGLDAHAEDDWIGRRVQIGEAVVLPRGHVGRCLITSQDPDTGVPDADTLDVLRSYRGELETTEPLALGVVGRVVEPGRVALGDAVTVV